MCVHYTTAIKAVSLWEGEFLDQPTLTTKSDIHTYMYAPTYVYYTYMYMYIQIYIICIHNVANARNLADGASLGILLVIQKGNKRRREGLIGALECQEIRDSPNLNEIPLVRSIVVRWGVTYVYALHNYNNYM